MNSLNYKNKYFVTNNLAKIEAQLDIGIYRVFQIKLEMCP